MSEKPRILIADDEEGTRAIVSLQLNEAGFNVDQASDGDEAITMLQANKYEIALLDIRMPRVNGIEVLKFLREHSPNTKAIILTGFADLELAMEAMELGAIDFFNKPFSIDDLIASVRQATSW